jgi:uncharacterized membrane protein YdjX (TVP38/TMEM64 family)/rhodanese-related sulfurtransferase
MQRAIAAAALIAAISIGAWLGRGQLDFAALQSWLGQLGAWKPLVFAACFALGTVFFLPGAAFGLLGGALFGPVQGPVVNLAGATLGATVSFLLARYVASEWVARRMAGSLKTLVDGVEAEGWRFVALTRLVPIVPFNLLNYALGLTRIRVIDYVIASAICMLPGTAAYTWLGHAGRNALDGDADSLRYGLAALGLLAAIVLLPRLVRRLRAPSSAWMQPADLDKRRFSPDALTIVDVRTADEFTGPLGHIARAVNIPVDELPARLVDLTPTPGRMIVVVCRTDRRSARAAAVLRSAGLHPVAVLRGGMERWNAERRSVEWQPGALASVEIPAND